MQTLLFIGGFAVEAFGLTLTAVGLWRTWQANTDGSEPLWPWVRRFADFLRYSVLRRKRPPTTLTPSGSAHGHFGFSANVHGYRSLTDEMTVEQKIETVQENARSALSLAARARDDLIGEQRKREQALKGLDDRVTRTEAELMTYAKRLAVDGIPMAIGGLFFIGLGLLIQTVGNLV